MKIQYDLISVKSFSPLESLQLDESTYVDLHNDFSFIKLLSDNIDNILSLNFKGISKNELITITFEDINNIELFFEFCVNSEELILLDLFYKGTYVEGFFKKPKDNKDGYSNFALGFINGMRIELECKKAWLEYNKD